MGSRIRRTAMGRGNFDGRKGGYGTGSTNYSDNDIATFKLILHNTSRNPSVSIMQLQFLQLQEAPHPDPNQVSLGLAYRPI